MARAKTLVWFRNDLRLADNPALHAACEGGGPVVLLYILDERAGAASRWWLHHSLTALGLDIAARGGFLLLRRGDPLKIIPKLTAALGVEAVHAARAYEPAWREAGRALDAALKKQDIGFHRHLSTSLFPPERITTQAGRLYGVFTPFAKACMAAGMPEISAPAPARINGMKGTSDALEDWQLLPTLPEFAAFPWAPDAAALPHPISVALIPCCRDKNSTRTVPMCATMCPSCGTSPMRLCTRPGWQMMPHTRM